MYKYDSKINRWRDKKGRFVSEKRVPLRYNFYYDSRVNRYRDTKTGKYLSKEKVLQFVENNNLGKINVLSKSGKLYRDNKIIERLKKDVYDLAVTPKVESMKGINMYTFTKDITDFNLIEPELYTWEYPEINKLVDIIYSFYKANHIKINDNVRLYIFFNLWVKNESTLEERPVITASDQITERGVTNDKIKKMVELFKETHDDDIKKQNYQDIILDLQAYIVLKEWHKGGKK